MSEFTNIEQDLKQVEHDVESVLHHGEQDLSAEAQQAAEDAKSDVADVKADVEQEKAVVEQDIKDVEQHPADAPGDVAGVVHDVETDAKDEAVKIEGQAKEEEQTAAADAQQLEGEVKQDVADFGQVGQASQTATEVPVQSEAPANAPLVPNAAATVTQPQQAFDPQEEAEAAKAEDNEDGEKDERQVIAEGLKQDFAERHQAMLDLREEEKDKAPSDDVTATPESWANRIPPQQVSGLPVHEV